MRRSGSHFCMHRTLGSVRIAGDQCYGAHINSIGMGKFKTRRTTDVAKTLARRKLNYFYLDERKHRPRWSDEPRCEQLRDSLYSWLSGNGSLPELQFLAINIEDTPIDVVIDQVRWLFSPIPYFAEAVKSFPVFVTLRAIRSIALSRKEWVDKNPKNIMAHGFKKLPLGVWEDHYRCVRQGSSDSNHPVIGLHYKRGVETGGQSLLDSFQPNVPLDCAKVIPSWIRGYVMADGKGSSFVGGGINKEKAVIQSIDERARRLDEFDYLFDRSELAKEHAERFGEA